MSQFCELNLASWKKSKKSKNWIPECRSHQNRWFLRKFRSLTTYYTPKYTFFIFFFENPNCELNQPERSWKNWKKSFFLQNRVFLQLFWEIPTLRPRSTFDFSTIFLKFPRIFRNSRTLDPERLKDPCLLLTNSGKNQVFSPPSFSGLR